MLFLGLKIYLVGNRLDTLAIENEKGMKREVPISTPQFNSGDKREPISITLMHSTQKRGYEEELDGCVCLCGTIFCYTRTNS